MAKTAPKTAKARRTEASVSKEDVSMVQLPDSVEKGHIKVQESSVPSNGQPVSIGSGKENIDSKEDLGDSSNAYNKKRGRPKKGSEYDPTAPENIAAQQLALLSMDRQFVNPKQRDTPKPPPSKQQTTQSVNGKTIVNMMNYRGTRFIVSQFVTLHQQHKVNNEVGQLDPRHPSFQCWNQTHHVGKIISFSMDTNSNASQWMVTVQLCRRIANKSDVAFTNVLATIPAKLLRNHCFVLTTTAFDTLAYKFKTLDIKLYADILLCNLKEFSNSLVPWLGGDCRIAVAEVYIQALSRVHAVQGIPQYISVSEEMKDKVLQKQEPHNSALLFREKEYQHLYKFLKGSISRRACGTMYIAGMPGTGKSATVQRVLQTLEEERGHQPDYTALQINAAMLSDPNDILPVIYQHFTKQRLIGTQADAKLTEFFQESGKNTGQVIILVLDEIDYLITKDQAQQYKVVEWPALPHAKVIIVGISNTFDLPNRLLSRVESRIGLAKQLFEPYTKSQLLEITRKYLPNACENISDDALNLAASRVAASNGDARRMIAQCKQAIFDQDQVDIHSMDSTMRKLYETNLIYVIQHSPIQDQIFLLSLLHCLPLHLTSLMDLPPIHIQLVLSKMEYFAKKTGQTFSTNYQDIISTSVKRLKQADIIDMKYLFEIDNLLLLIKANYDTIHFALSKHTLLSSSLPSKK